MLKIANESMDEELATHTKTRHAKLKDKLYSAESEADVRQTFLSLYDLDLVGNLEKNRMDYYHDELLIEFKHDVDLRKFDVRIKILAQALHYLYLLPTRHKQRMLPDTLALVDRKNVVLYETSDFLNYILYDGELFKEALSPSKDHPSLERKLRRDRCSKGKLYTTIADYDQLWCEFEKRGVYEGLIPVQDQPE